MQIFSAWVADDNTVTWGLFGFVHAEINAAVFLEQIPFLERIRIEQQLNTFAGSQLALLVLAVDTLLATAEVGHFALFFQLADDVVHRKLPKRIG